MEETAVERALLYIEPGPVVLATTFDGTFVADGKTYNCRELMLSKLPPGLLINASEKSFISIRTSYLYSLYELFFIESSNSFLSLYSSDSESAISPR